MSGRLSYVSILSFFFFFLRGKKLVWGLMALVYENEKCGHSLGQGVL